MPAIPILCGSETGNAEYCADMLSAALDSEGFESEVIDMMAFDGPSIAHHPLVFIVTSTYGNGGPPSNAEELLAYLQTSAIDLSAVRFAVCGLGSHTFDRFAQCGKDFEAAMLKAGATQVFDRVDCDDDYEEGYGKFEASALSYLQEHGLSSPGAASVPRVAPTPTPAPRETTAQAPLVAKRLLSRSGSKKETMHYELDLSNVAMNYEVGDCFAIHAINSRNAIQEVIDSAGLRSDDAVEFGGATTTLEKALERSCLLQCTDALFEHVAERGTPGAAARAAREGGRDAVRAYRKDRHVAELLSENAAGALDAQRFVNSLRKLQPRLFSVASAPGGDRVAFTVETVRYERGGRHVRGVASGWLADDIEVGDTVAIHHVPNDAYRFPEDERPVIMIGPGTGIAPFRAYLEQRHRSGERRPTWLFFGHQHEAADFLYEEEIKSWLEAGTLTRADFAWSRDQTEKVYVQDKMRANADELWNWLERGASVFVCGDAKRMAPGVVAAIKAIASEHGDGDAYFEKLLAEDRYKADVY